MAFLYFIFLFYFSSLFSPESDNPLNIFYKKKTNQENLLSVNYLGLQDFNQIFDHIHVFDNSESDFSLLNFKDKFDSSINLILYFFNIEKSDKNIEILTKIFQETIKESQNDKFDLIFLKKILKKAIIIFPSNNRELNITFDELESYKIIFDSKDSPGYLESTFYFHLKQMQNLFKKEYKDSRLVQGQLSQSIKFYKFLICTFLITALSIVSLMIAHLVNDDFLNAKALTVSISSLLILCLCVGTCTYKAFQFKVYKYFQNNSVDILNYKSRFNLDNLDELALSTQINQNIYYLDEDLLIIIKDFQKLLFFVDSLEKKLNIDRFKVINRLSDCKGLPKNVLLNIDDLEKNTVAKCFVDLVATLRFEDLFCHNFYE